MNAQKKYARYTWFVLVMVFAVILAGGLVRMTQSGMGCPDWPKCFGRWIPPTDASQLPPDFEKYLRRQDIDHSFNPYHTWIEYINRLLGALLGVFIFIHFIWTWLKFRKTNKKIVLASFLLLLAVGFQGWLGKKVVDANLAVVKITTHMLVALLIAAIPVWILVRLKAAEAIKNNRLKIISSFLLLAVLVQVVLGTEVREQVDEISKALNFGQRDLWVGQLDIFFLIHRSFSWVVAAGGVLLFWTSRNIAALKAHAISALFVIISTVILGLILAFFNIPALAQPLHLMLASVLITVLIGYRLRLQ